MLHALQAIRPVESRNIPRLISPIGDNPGEPWHPNASHRGCPKLPRGLVLGECLGQVLGNASAGCCTTCSFHSFRCCFISFTTKTLPSSSPCLASYPHEHLLCHSFILYLPIYPITTFKRSASSCLECTSFPSCAESLFSMLSDCAPGAWKTFQKENIRLFAR